MRLKEKAPPGLALLETQPNIDGGIITHVKEKCKYKKTQLDYARLS